MYLTTVSPTSKYPRTTFDSSNGRRGHTSSSVSPWTLTGGDPSRHSEIELQWYVSRLPYQTRRRFHRKTRHSESIPRTDPVLLPSLTVPTSWSERQKKGSVSLRRSTKKLLINSPIELDYKGDKGVSSRYLLLTVDLGPSTIDTPVGSERNPSHWLSKMSGPRSHPVPDPYRVEQEIPSKDPLVSEEVTECRKSQSFKKDYRLTRRR